MAADRAFFVTPEGLARLQSIDEQSVEGAYVRLGAVDDDVRQRLADPARTLRGE